MKFKLQLIVFVLFLVSCEKETDWDLQQGERVLVIDALITNELKTHSITFHSSSEKINQPPTPVSGAIIKLESIWEQILFVEDSLSPGKYYSEKPTRVAAGVRYRLVVEHGTIRDTAYADLVAITPLSGLKIEPTDNLFRLRPNNTGSPSMTEIVYDWENVPDHCLMSTLCKASETIYKLDVVGLHQTFAPQKQVIEFPMGTAVIRKKYSLSPSHQDFIQSLLIETEWRGGIFDVEHGNVKTNFGNGLRGWFATCMVLSDTTLIDEKLLAN